MPRFIAALSIRARLLIMLIITGFSILLLAAMDLQEKRDIMLQDRAHKIRSLTESAHAILGHYHTLAAQGRLSEANAREEAKAAVRALRYDGNEYFWINDLQQVVVAHPMRPEFEGQDKSDMTDPNGKKVYQEMVQLARTQGGGFVDYYWPRGGAKEPIAKLSYVQLFEPWGWVIGTGLYLDDVDAMFWQSVRQAGLWLAGIMLLGGAIMLFLARSIIRPVQALRELGAAMHDIRINGNLSRRAAVAGDDEVAQIGHSFNELLESISASIRDVNASAVRVEEAGTRLTARTGEVRGAAARQAEDATNAAVAVEELSASVSMIADKTAEAATAARGAGELSERGEAQMHEVTQHMNRLSDTVTRASATIESLGQRSGEITTIVKVIKDIADQTNLLALNAAIEAARAGEQGRGFAVVADEVRKLAERSGNATTQISDMIDSIQHDTGEAVRSMTAGSRLVKEGVERVDQAGQAMNAITSNTRQIVSVMEDIAASVREQSAASNDISTRVERIARMSETSDSASASTHEEAQALQQVAGELRGAMQKFKC
ncbi:MAG: methyl-accepting chemotaxis protein [Burkholderiales bacterium]|nr:methyl-accepting chemotaxis protein [Burkholderiales bacterium]